MYCDVLGNVANMAAFMRNRFPSLSPVELDWLLFLCDRESFLKNDQTISGHWPGMHPDLEYLVGHDGVCLLYKGVPWSVMACCGAGMPSEFDDGEFSNAELEIMELVAAKGQGVSDPLRWRERTLDAKGFGAKIDFEELESVEFSPNDVEKRRSIRNHLRMSQALMEKLDRCEKDAFPAAPDWKDSYRILDLRGEFAGVILRRFFGRYDFSFRKFPSDCESARKKMMEELFTGHASGDGGPVDCERAPEDCDNPFMAIKLEGDYPVILPWEGSFAGFRTPDDALVAIRKDMSATSPWLVTMHRKTWQKPFWSLSAIPKVFKSQASAFAWLKENCGLTDECRRVMVFVDGINTAYCDDLPGPEGWRIVKTEAL